jgi:hypothetical protein
VRRLVGAAGSTPSTGCCRTCGLVLCVLLAFILYILSISSHFASSASPPRSWRGVSAWPLQNFTNLSLFDLLRDVHHLAGTLRYPGCSKFGSRVQGSHKLVNAHSAPKSQVNDGRGLVSQDSRYSSPTLAPPLASCKILCVMPKLATQRDVPCLSF